MTKKSMIFALFMVSWMVVLQPAVGQSSADYLGNNQRTGYVDVEVPSSPKTMWIYHEKHPPQHAWKEPNREIQYIDFDYADQTAIGSGMVFFGSSADHKLYALDLASGAERWHFYTEGPIRFAPVVRAGRVYAASDDGCVYCLETKTGKLIWSFRGGPANKKLIGNEQMISRWPARTGVLVENGRLYCSFGMWSRDGVFLYCLDSADGSVIWRNDTSGHHFMSLPHASGYGGVSPQGYLLLHKNTLYVPTGRGAPAYFDAANGDFLFYENGAGYKPHQAGGSQVMAWKDWIIFKRRLQHQEENVRYEERDPGSGPACGLVGVHWSKGRESRPVTDENLIRNPTKHFDVLEDGWSLTGKNLAVADGDMMVMAGAGAVIRVDMAEILKNYPDYWRDGKSIAFDKNIAALDVDYVHQGIVNNEKKAKGGPRPKPGWMSPLPYSKWKTDIGRVYFMLQAGDTLLAGGRGKVSALDVETGKIVWQRSIDGDARGICAADGCLVVSSTAGKLYCFGQAVKADSGVVESAIERPSIDSKTRDLANNIVQDSSVEAGYCLMLGAGDGQLLCALASRPQLVVYCLEPDESKAAKVRKMLDDAALLGTRAAVHVGAFEKLPYAPYVANLIVWGDALGSGIDKLNSAELYRVLRPYGGVACCLAGGTSASSVREWMADGGVPSAEISSSRLGLAIKRGALPGAGEWTHPYANIGRTGCSGDKKAQVPFGMLWWGGPGPARIVSRHWRAPVPLFCNGILYVQGQHDVIAVDAYNGREMWNRHLESVGRFPPTKRGGNIVADNNFVYCVVGNKCLRLDAQTGKTVNEYVLPGNTEDDRNAVPASDASRRDVWEYLGITENYIIGTIGNGVDGGKKLPFSQGPQQSRYVFVLDKANDNLLWKKKLDRAVSPMAIVAGDTRLFLLDRTDEYEYRDHKRRGNLDQCKSTLKCLDLATGRSHWEKSGIRLELKSLMLKDDLLVTYPNPVEVREAEAEKGIAVYSAVDGNLIWEKEKLLETIDPRRGGVARHTFIVGDKLFVPRMLDLRTGKELTPRKNPLSGADEKFRIYGNNFCGTVSAGENILAFRSASIGFKEISRDSGCYWWPEERPSCWISLLPAGGLMLAPEGYSTCICPYNYKTSMALMPVERNENWSVYLEAGSTRNQQSRAARKEKEKQIAKHKLIEKVKTLRMNLNAPGDQMDADKKLWMSYPRPFQDTNHYLCKLLPVECSGVDGKFRYNSDYHAIAGTRHPWLFTSALQGDLVFNIRLSDNEEHRYSVKLYFAETTRDEDAGKRVFDVEIQNQKVISNLDIADRAGGVNRAYTEEINGIAAKGSMTIKLLSVAGKPPSLCALEIVEE